MPRAVRRTRRVDAHVWRHRRRLPMAGGRYQSPDLDPGHDHPRPGRFFAAARVRWLRATAPAAAEPRRVARAVCRPLAPEARAVRSVRGAAGCERSPPGGVLLLVPDGCDA